jgi:hypothetical protein
MAEDINRYSDPKPRNGIGKSGVAAVAICVICAVAMTFSSIAMILKGAPDNPEPTPPGQTETTPGTTPPDIDDPVVDGPGGTETEKDVIRELTLEEKCEVVGFNMFGEGYTSIEALKVFVNDECSMELDGKEVEAIKLIAEAKLTRANGEVDYRMASISTPINEENKNMDALELSEYLFDNGNTNMKYNETQKRFEGSFEFGEQTKQNRLEGSVAVREDLKNGKVLDQNGYKTLEALRDNLCRAVGFDVGECDVIITDFIEREVNAKGDVEFVIRYDVYDETGCVAYHYESIIESDAMFRDKVKEDEIYSTSEYDMNLIISQTTEVDRYGKPLNQTQEQGRGL